jgi:dTDP-4-amino-4,6-dideoxygalactose transaminase
MIIRRKIDMEDYEFFRLLRLENHDPKIIKDWERAFAGFIGVKHACVVQSGRQGLFHLLSKLGLKPGDEVIAPAYTLIDLIPIIESAKAKVVLADIDRETFNISPEEFEKKITARTKAVIAAHMFGSPCDIVRICDIARKHSIFVIEDCAHSVGAHINGKQTGSFGDAALFSFEIIKPINTYGGGMIVSNNKKFLAGTPVPELSSAKAIQKAFSSFCENTFAHSPLSFPPMYLMSTGLRPKIIGLYRKFQGTPRSAYSPLQASLGLRRLKTLDVRIKKRASLAKVYSRLLKLPAQKHIGTPNQYFHVVLYHGNTMALKKHMALNFVDIGVLDEITDDCSKGKCKNSRYAFRHAVQLPMHEGMIEGNVKKVCRLLASSDGI